MATKKKAKRETTPDLDASEDAAPEKKRRGRPPGGAKRYMPLRIPPELIERADRLAASLDEREADLGAAMGGWTRSAVLRLAIARGLTALEGEHGGPVDPEALGARILAAVKALTPAEGPLVPIHLVRAEVAEPNRGAFDEAVHALVRDGRVDLSKITDPRNVTDAQRRDSLVGRLTGEMQFYVKLRGDGPTGGGPPRVRARGR